MDIYKSLIRPRLFAMDPEEAHEQMLRFAKKVQASPLLLALIAWIYRANKNPDLIKIGNLTFRNRVGLAAGFDKQGDLALLMQAFGFGFVTVGTVLPNRQEGQQKPRLFRIPEHDALINRCGFNSDGAKSVASKINLLLGQLDIPLGISLSKMKETPLEKAAEDCLTTMHVMHHVAHYWEICVSSPNTPNLRKLQEKERVEELVHAVVEKDRRLVQLFGGEERMVFLKIAPDLSEGEIEETVAAARKGGAAGFVVGNTTIGREGVKGLPNAEETGGLSGPPLYFKARRAVRRVRETAKHTIIFGAGGINSPRKADGMYLAGADLIQVLTGLVYEGPGLVKKLRTVR